MPLTKTQLYALAKNSPALAISTMLESIKTEAVLSAERVAREEMRKMKEEMMLDMKREMGDKMHLMEMIDEDELQEMTEDISAIVLKEIPKPKDGYSPLAGKDYPTDRQIEAFIRQLFASIEIPTPQDGYTPVAGKDYPDKEQMKKMCVEYLKGMKCLTEQDIPALYEKMKARFPSLELTGEQIVDKINALPITPEKQIDAKHIKNLPKAVQQKLGGRGGGGGGLTELTATGAVNGVNTTFTFVQKPKYLVSDGVWYRENDNWTFSGLTATLTIPPAVSIYGIS